MRMAMPAAAMWRLAWGIEYVPKWKIEAASTALTDLYAALKAMLLGMGSDVQEKQLQQYVAFKRIKNFATVDVRAGGQEKLLVYVKVNPDTVTLEEGFTRDVRDIGHWGTGDLEITIRSMDDLTKARPLLEKSYEDS